MAVDLAVVRFLLPTPVDRGRVDFHRVSLYRKSKEEFDGNLGGVFGRDGNVRSPITRLLIRASYPGSGSDDLTTGDFILRITGKFIYFHQSSIVEKIVTCRQVFSTVDGFSRDLQL